MNRITQILNIVLSLSVVLAIWLVLLFASLQIMANSGCIQYGAPRALVTLSSGFVCVAVKDGTEYVAPLNYLRENIGDSRPQRQTNEY